MTEPPRMAPLFAVARRQPEAAGSGAAPRANDDELPLAEAAEERVEAAGGSKIMMKWEGFGWMLGSITQANEDARRAIEGKKVNFFVLYKGEESNGPVPHVLEGTRYQTEEDGEYDSWFLLEPEPLEAGAAAGAATAMEV
jgi:hypothetical protein